ncbi:MAG: TonB-dependent receptor [Aquabacterium sp.]
MTTLQVIPFRPTGLCAALATAGLLVSLSAVAQQAPPAKAEEDSSQKVVITANKRVEKQRDVAGTVSVLDGSELERRGARDQEDLFKLTPGVQLNRGDPGNNNITIRGLTTQSAVEGGGLQQQPTGFYLEDVPLGSPIGKGLVVDILPFDLDRVEVLRGPQGALFGSGSLGGAARYLFAKPNLKATEAAVQVGSSTVSGGGTALSAYGMVNTPLADGRAALRVVLFDRNDPGYIDNLATRSKDANEVNQRGGRLLITFKPVKALTATLVASTQTTKQDDASYVFPSADKLEHNNPTLGTAKPKFDFSSLTVDYDLGGLTLTSITGYWKTRTSSRGDDTELFKTLGLVAPVIARFADGTSNAKSQELRISNAPGSALSFVAGVFYQRSEGSSVALQVDESGTIGNLFGIPGLTKLVDLSTTLSGTETAAFIDGEYNLGNGWSAGLGARYYRTSTKYKSLGTVFGGPSDSTPPDGKDSGTTPKVTVKYRFGDNLWYALASQGYRYGGVNGTPPFATYKSDSLWNYETGVRLTPARGIQLDLTAFILDWKDAQFTYFDGSGPLPFSGIGNVGKAKSTGLEAAGRFRLTSTFDVAASVAYIDAKTTKDVTTLIGRGPGVIASGAKLPGTAKLQTALQANFRFAGPFDSQGRFNATHTHLGKRKMDLTGFYEAPSFSTLDLGLSFAKGNWTLATGLSNVTDERGILSITGTPTGSAFQQYYLQRPRTLNMSLRYDY